MNIDINMHELNDADFYGSDFVPIEIIVAQIAVSEIFRDYDEDFAGDIKYVEWRLNKLLGFDFFLTHFDNNYYEFSTKVDNEIHSFKIKI
jgi:hypothetical protein